jgi:hypothetical protein
MRRRTIGKPLPSGRALNELLTCEVISLSDELALEEDSVHPAVQFPTHILQGANAAEAEAFVETDGSKIGRVADNRDQLAAAGVGASGDYLNQERPADAAPVCFRTEINRVFGGETVGGPGAPACRPGDTDDFRVDFGYQMREALFENVRTTAKHFNFVGWNFFEGGRGVSNVVAVDFRYSRNV